MLHGLDLWRAAGLLSLLCSHVSTVNALIHNESGVEQTGFGEKELPQGCISYADRYSKYTAPGMLQTMYDPNDLYPDARQVVVIRLHYGIHWQKDLVLFLLSAAHEMSAAGWHMYLLVQDSTHEPAEEDDTPERFRRSLPAALRPMLFLYDEADVHRLYPKIHVFKRHVRDYLPYVYFLHRFPGYEFAWFMEYDVRYTGPSFAAYLQGLLDAADRRLQAREAEQEAGTSQGKRHRTLLQADEEPAKRDHISGSSNQAQEEENRKKPLMPDLLYVGPDLDLPQYTVVPGNESTYPRDYIPELWNNMTTIYARLLVLMGWSRTFAQTLHAWSSDGKGGYLEDFLPTLAYAADLKAVGLSVDQYYNNSYHCCYVQQAQRFYQAFHRHKSRCFPYALLHPIKLEGAYWDAQAGNHIGF